MSGENKVSLNPGAYPALRIALVYACGILSGRVFHPDFSFFYLYSGLAGIIFFYGILAQRTSPVIRLQLLPFIYLFCIAGYGFINSHVHHQPIHADEKLLQAFDPGYLTYFGGVTSDRKTRSGNRLLSIQVDSVRIRGLPTWQLPFKSEALVRSASGPSSFDQEESFLDTGTGYYIHFKGELRQPQPPGNPNQFDYAAFLSRQGIHTQIFVSEITNSHKNSDAPFWIRQQVRIRASITALFSDSNAPLARAIILGDRSRLDHQLRTDFSRSGLAHLMAVSGMHVGFILLPIWFLLPWFRRSHGMRITALISGGLLLICYAGITGFSVSVSRAALMAFFLMIARLYHKPGTSMNILGAASLVLLLIDPLMLYDIGFQLSFIAVIIILTTLPGTRYLLPPRLRYRKTGALFQFIMVSILVQGGLYPLLIHFFNEFSIAGPVSNTLAVPFVQLMFLWSFFCLGFSSISGAAAVFLNAPGDYILTGLTRYVTWIGSQPAAWIEGTLPDNLIYGIWIFGISTLASLRIPTIRWKMLCGLLVIFTLYQSGKVLDLLRSPELKITFFDVGQGDAVLLQTPGGYNYLYDTGIWTPHYDSGERTLIPELRAAGINRLDGVILSHPHADHIGGIVSLMEHIPIDTIYQSPIPYDSHLYHQYMELAYEKRIPIRLLSTGDMIYTNTSLPMLVLAPSDSIAAADPNNRSVVLLVRYGDTRLLLTGDAEKEAEAFLVDTFGSFLESDLMKIGHHASRTSSTLPFLELVNAPLGIASLAKNNRYDHPHPEATRRIRHTNISVRYTSLEGAIIFKSDGRYYRHVSWRQD